MGTSGLRRALAAIAATLLCVSCSRGEPPKAGRAKLDVGGVTWRVLSGSWKKEGDTLVGSGGHIQTALDLTDGTLEMDVEEQRAPGTVAIGFHYLLVDDDPARSSGYRVNLSGSAFNVFRGANDYWLPVSPETKGLVKSSIVDPRKNHVIVRMKAAFYEIEVNGAALTSFTDASYPHGHLNLWVETASQSVVFSNIRISS